MNSACHDAPSGSDGAQSLKLHKLIQAISVAVRDASEGMAGVGDVDHQSSDLAAANEEIAMLRGEIGRLNAMLNAHVDGVQSASKAGLDVLGERARQRRAEGYDDAHDDAQDDFSLTSGAIAYLMDARLRGTSGQGFEAAPADWPWDFIVWKPKPIRQSLIIAGALLIAEAERLDRDLSR